MSSFTIARFERALAASLPSGPEDRPPALCVALSGGLDSTVLLVALAELAQARAQPWAMRALHVDHGLHADAAHWSLASHDLARSVGVPFEQVQVDASAAPGQSPEAAARDARYAAFRQRLDPGEVLLTAHHADDQLETVLLQWLRGGGLRAVAGMPPLAPFGGHAWHARPLLPFERVELERFARERGLAWVEDPSNADLRFDRNFLRRQVLPVLRRRWPAAARTVGRVAEYARDALALEAEVARGDLQALRRGLALDLARLRELPDARQRAVLRAWLTALDLPLPAAETLAALRRDVCVAADDRNPRTVWPGAHVHRYRGYLHAAADRLSLPVEGEWHTTQSRRYDWSAQSSLELQTANGLGLSRARLPARVRIACRAGGEQFRPAGAAHRRPLRKWLQEHAVLPWRRMDLPLLLDAAGEVVAVADLVYAEEYAAQPGEPSWSIVWQGRGVVTEPDAFGFRWPEDHPIG
ncbi:MAG TPA: tRNA lysidine(34) synthetase TilS [Steroidobacteraceae bacterium]|nr:tRNA lysidine(34) synthetase TilS [Steroidobacteraceae bacterium]